MQFLNCDVQTTCVGQAASMGALLLAGGPRASGSRCLRARILIHQPWGGAQGQARDIKIQAQEIIRLKNLTIDIFARHTGKTAQAVAQDLERDFFMSAQEAADYGLVDRVLVREKHGQRK